MITRWLIAFAILSLAYIPPAHANKTQDGSPAAVRGIVASDTLLSGMLASLLPSHRYAVEAILPPGQCPGHYDVKLSDVRKIQKADLNVCFRGMAFMDKAGLGPGSLLLIDRGERNWMAPDSYIYGLGILAGELAKRFPADKREIMIQREITVRKVKTATKGLTEKIKRAGIPGKSVIASSMQKEPLEWMGFRVAGEYGRPEAISTKDVIRLSKIGREQRVFMVVDNLQSGPDTGKNIAETLGTPHVVLTNFPTANGYLATLEDNVNAVLAVVNWK